MDSVFFFFFKCLFLKFVALNLSKQSHHKMQNFMLIFFKNHTFSILLDGVVYTVPNNTTFGAVFDITIDASKCVSLYIFI